MITIDESLARARGAADVLLQQSLRQLAARLRQLGYSTPEIMAAVAEHRENCLAERDEKLEQLRDQLAEMLSPTSD